MSGMSDDRESNNSPIANDAMTIHKPSKKRKADEKELTIGAARDAIDASDPFRALVMAKRSKKSAKTQSTEKTTKDSSKKKRPAVTGVKVDGTPRKRNKPQSTLEVVAIPRTYEECSPADKMLIDWRDAGEDWPKIVKQYEMISGMKGGCKALLPNRYQRMKTYFAVINEEDQLALFQAKAKIDKIWESELWERIADEVAETTNKTYAPDVLRRAYRRVMEHGDEPTEEEIGSWDGSARGNESVHA